MPGPLLFSAFVMNTSSHILHGVWRQPDARQIEFNSLELWVNLAKELEAGLFDVIFFADVTGTPEQIAQQLATWQQAGIDGINVINATIPGSYTEFIEHVMPELRKRGLAKEAYTPGTLRRKIFGNDRLPLTHPATAYRNAFR